MTLSSTKICLGIASIFILFSSCDDELEQPRTVAFHFSVSEQFLFIHTQYLLFVSDKDGNVLAIDQLNSRSNEIVVPESADGIYDVTLFDGKNAFATYARLAPDKYEIGWFPDNFGSVNKGKHSLFIDGVNLTSASSEHLSFSTYVSDQQRDLILAKEKSDLYVSFRINDEPRYLYYPEIVINESTTLNTTSIANAKAFKKQPVSKGNATPPLTIYLSGSVDADDKMEYSLSGSGPFEGDDLYLNIPEELTPKLTYYKTIFETGEGTRYTYVGPQVATEFKGIQSQVGGISATEHSLTYSVISNGTYLEWQARGTDCSWSIISPPGNNITVNLPKLPDGIVIGYGLKNLSTLAFGAYGYHHRDTRFPTYLDFVKSKLKKEQLLSTSSYEMQDQILKIKH